VLFSKSIFLILKGGKMAIVRRVLGWVSGLVGVGAFVFICFEPSTSQSQPFFSWVTVALFLTSLWVVVSLFNKFEMAANRHRKGWNIASFVLFILWAVPVSLFYRSDSPAPTLRQEVLVSLFAFNWFITDFVDIFLDWLQR
jgi:hypothetical protein